MDLLDWHKNNFGGPQMFGVITCYATFTVTSAHSGFNFKLRISNMFYHRTIVKINSSKFNHHSCSNS